MFGVPLRLGKIAISPYKFYLIRKVVSVHKHSSVQRDEGGGRREEGGGRREEREEGGGRRERREEGGGRRERREEREDRLTCHTGWDELHRPYTVSNPVSL